MLSNEDRADIGEDMVVTGGRATNVVNVEDAETALTDCLAYMAHFADRLGLDPEQVFASGLLSYRGDWEDGPRAEHAMRADCVLYSDGAGDIPAGA